jgi:ubiquitin carboxyl-terminal hydrolase 36/42
MWGGKAACPDWLITDAGVLHERFRGPVQQDAHEFLLAVIGRFKQELRNALPEWSGESDDFMDLFFGWKVQSRVRCAECGFASESEAEFVDWTVPVKGIESVGSVIGDLMMGEKRVSEGCRGCGREGRGVKTSVVLRFPLILMVTLMRFDNQLRKIGDFVEFSEIVAVQGGEHRYQLYAMIVHEGKVINHGHFFAYVRDEGGSWYKADDVCVFRVKAAVVMKSTPYVLFYRLIV